MAYGFSFKKSNKNNEYIVTFIALKTRPVTLKYDKINNKPILTCNINGEPSVLKHIYVEMKQGYAMPTVLWIVLKGYRLKDGYFIWEKIDNK